MALPGLFQPLGKIADQVGTKLNLPELHVSEFLGGYTNPTAWRQQHFGGLLAPDKGPGGAYPGAAPAASAPQASAPTGGVAAAGPDPGQVNGARDQALAALHAVNTVYQSLFNNVDTLTNSRRTALDQNYNDQFAQQDKNLANTQDQTVNMFAGRGAGNSSANAVAQGQNVDLYNQDRQNLVNDRSQKYADLGKFATTTKASLSANRPQYDLSKYSDVNQLMGIKDQLDNHIKTLQETQAGLQTDANYQNQLNSIAPAQSNLEGQLAGKLSTLAKSSAPDSAKASIAKGYLKLAGKDPNDSYWSQYFLNLLNPQQSQG